MKKLHTLLASLTLCICVLAACSSCKDDKETNYLTNVANVKSGIVGTWQIKSGGTIGNYIRYDASGNVYSGTSQASISLTTKYEILQSGSNYILREYDSPSSATYYDTTISTLTETSLICVSLSGYTKNELVRVK